ncbi:uncharacterized protein LOC134470818 [Cavia porcellus]|uniref:uncharacterized protein LOC134470818 n=1 Tax=Cavia porcellus TaxID=10141 RepID=UPI002FE24D90
MGSFSCAGDFPFPEAQSSRCGGLGETGRRPHLPSSLRCASHSLRLLLGVQKQLPGFGLPPGETPGPIWDCKQGGNRKRLLEISHIKTGIKKGIDARLTSGGESARGSAAAAIFPPLRTHGARGRSAAALPPPSLGLGKDQPCCRRHPLASAAAAAAVRLQDLARATAPLRAPPPPPPSPFVSSAPAPPPRLALCRGRSARPQRAREKPRNARARLRARPLLLLPTCARASWPRAGAAWRAGGEVAGALAGGAHLFARVPPPSRKVEEGEAGRLRGESRVGSIVGGGSYVWGGVLSLDIAIRAGGVCAGRTCETTEPRARTCGECGHFR